MTKLAFYMPVTWPTVPRSTFVSVLNMLMKPIPDVEITPFIHTVFPLDFNRNDAVERCADYDYIFFADADMVFPAYAIRHLLELICEATPVVTGVYYRKKLPHLPVVGHYVDNKKAEHYMASLDSLGFIDPEGKQCLIFDPADVSRETPFLVDAFGLGCLLVKTSVFKSLRQPYFRYFSRYDTGDYKIPKISEDMWFCASLKKAGIQVLCDPRVQCGHIKEEIVDQGSYVAKVMA